MRRKTNMLMRITIGLALLLLACQSIGFGSTQTDTEPKPWPHSTFVPAHKSIFLEAGQEVQIESHHASDELLTGVQIFVNGQPLTTEAASAAGQTGTFPPDLAAVRVVTQDDEITASGVEPAMPTYEKTVTVVWTGRVPGIYDLSMVATDAANRTGNTIIQRIEVK